MTHNLTLSEAAESAAKLILDGGHVERWVEGSIFPSEMAFFLAVCDSQKIKKVIESGRQDGYSTAILGDWGDHTGAKIISIDLESDQDRAVACRLRLVNYKSLQLVRGNAYAEFGRYALDSRERTAFLTDGPKGAPAISMMAAALTDHVSVVASHNLHQGSMEYDYFRSIGDGSIFYENAIPNPGPNWVELRRRDVDHARRVGAVRPLEASSIGVLVLDERNRRAMKATWGKSFGLHQPAAVRLLWSLGAYKLTPLLYGASYRLLGR
ncbi:MULTISPECIES: hypothetical protein [Bradyrhizobium]|uniref:hypothetical protein n=1 Tax=Bradyrhizobium TaxID=374 RepID=UPI0005771ADA|nr:MULTISPECIES: hypothetical protein [Bradyrhizobium]